jgi:hypothetical protein
MEYLLNLLIKFCPVIKLRANKCVLAIFVLAVFAMFSLVLASLPLFYANCVDSQCNCLSMPQVSFHFPLL